MRSPPASGAFQIASEPGRGVIEAIAEAPIFPCEDIRFEPMAAIGEAVPDDKDMVMPDVSVDAPIPEDRTHRLKADGLARRSAGRKTFLCGQMNDGAAPAMGAPPYRAAR